MLNNQCRGDQEELSSQHAQYATLGSNGAELPIGVLHQGCGIGHAGEPQCVCVCVCV